MNFTFFGLGIFILLVTSAFIFLEHYRSTNPKSKCYKKYLTNMYVAAKIRYLATKDGLDLTQEEKNFLEYDASSKEAMKSLDEKIEADLMAQVIGKEDKKKDKEKDEK